MKQSLDYEVITINEPATLLRRDNTIVAVLQGKLILNLSPEDMVITNKEIYSQNEILPLSLINLFFKESYGL